MTPLDPKAVLDGRKPGRTSVGFIIGLGICSVCLLVALLIDAWRAPIPALLGLILAVPTAALLVAGVLFLDRLEPEPRDNLLFAFLWGAGVAALLAGVVNTLGMQLVTMPEFGKAEGYYISATVGAPLVEETLKGAVLIGLLRFRRQELDGPTDGIIYASMVGLGFALTENVGYYIQASHHGLGALAFTFVLRGLVSPLCHPLFTSMTGLGVAYAALHRGPGGVWAVVGGWVAAVILHGMWNGSTAAGLLGVAVVYLILSGVLVTLITVVILDRRRIVRLITRYLPAYEVTGLVTPYDIRMLSSLHGRRQGRHWARIHGGLPAVRAMADYQLAATELALLHQRAERGVIAPAEFADRRDELLALLHAARSAFLRRQPAPPRPPWAAQGVSGFGPRPPA